MANTVDRKPVVRVHITQDDFGYWMTSYEFDDGTMALASYRFEHAEHEIHHAYSPREIGLPADMEFLVSEPTIPLRAGAADWEKPEPRHARPFYIIRNGMRVN